MNCRRLLLGLMLGLSLVVNSRCQALLIGAECGAVVGAAAYKHGEVRCTLDLSLNGAWDATQKAMGHLGYAVISEGKDIPHARYRLTARGAGGKKIRITLERRSDALTDIGIRIGTFGDESVSRLILEKVKEQLGNRACDQVTVGLHFSSARQF